MPRQSLIPLAWLAPLVVLGGILILATWVDVQPQTVSNSSLSGRLTALMSCVLPAPTQNPSSRPAALPESSAPGCDASMPARLDTPRMTAC